MTSAPERPTENELQSDPSEGRRLAREARRRTSEERNADRKKRGRDGNRARRIRHVRRRIGAALLPYLTPTIVNSLRRSWRKQFLHLEHRQAVDKPAGFLVALWHGRMLPGVALHHHEGHTALVSPSDDGDIAAILLRKNGFEILRGTTSKGGGAAALRAIQDRLRIHPGGAFVITPDGPRGPRHSMNAGLVWLARESGLPILPLGFACTRAWRLRSWDAFTIPKFFSRVVINYGKPMFVPPETDAWQVEKLSAELRAEILRAEAEAFEHLGIKHDWPSDQG